MKKTLYYVFLGVILVITLIFSLVNENSFLFYVKSTIIAKIEDSKVIEYNKEHPTSDIDLVYLWVDGNDKEWQKEKEYWAKKYGVENKSENDDSRFVDNEELKYSLRSAEKNVPWVNKIYIVTNGQIPKWLNTNHPKIKMITQEQIMPKDALPTYNASAIEAKLAHIPDLSEKFLFSNDDTFFGRPLTPDYFFTKEGKAIVKTGGRFANLFGNKYYDLLEYSFDLFDKKYNEKNIFYEATHNITPYIKSSYLGCEKDFQDEFDKVTHAKFRKEKTVHRQIVNYYMKRENKAVFSPVKKGENLYTEINKLSSAKKRFKKYHPMLFCINDTDNVTNEDRLKLKPFLEKLFPEKSSFEK